jgi:hypothetical protein
MVARGEVVAFAAIARLIVGFGPDRHQSFGGEHGRGAGEAELLGDARCLRKEALAAGGEEVFTISSRKRKRAAELNRTPQGKIASEDVEIAGRRDWKL